jgi:hypothetical protein
MKQMTAGWTAAIALLICAGSLSAHHSLAQFDTDAPVWVKGSVVRFERVNPHSIVFLDQKKDDGRVERWAVDGPGVLQLDRMGVAQDVLKVGDVIEVCGFTLKSDIQPQRVFPAPGTPGLTPSAPPMKGRVINGHVLVMPDGKKRFWSNYGHLDKCLDPGETRESLIGIHRAAPVAERG